MTSLLESIYSWIYGDKTKSSKDASKDDLVLYSMEIDERSRNLIKVTMIIRFLFRNYFGVSFSNRCGFFMDHHMSTKIHSFADWIEYPTSDQEWKAHYQEITAAIVSFDGYYLYTVSYDKHIIVLDLVSMNQIHEWEAHEDVVRCVTYYSGLLVSGSNDSKINLWNSFTYELIHTMEGHTDSVLGLEFNTRGTRIVSASSDKTVRVWSVKSGECLTVLTGHTRYVARAYFIDDLIISASGDKSLKLWDPITATNTRTVTDGIKNDVFDMSVNCDSTLCVCLYDCGFIIFSWPGLETIGSTAGYIGYRGCFHSTNPRILAVVGGNYRSSIGIYDISSGEQIGTLISQTGTIEWIGFTPDGQRLICVSQGGFVCVKDVSDL